MFFHELKKCFHFYNINWIDLKRRNRRNLDFLILYINLKMNKMQLFFQQFFFENTQYPDSLIHIFQKI